MPGLRGGRGVDLSEHSNMDYEHVIWWAGGVAETRYGGGAVREGREKVVES